MQKQIICITNRHLVEGNFLDQMQQVAKAKVDAIVLREKDLAPREYEALSHEMKQMCEAYDVKLIYHFFADIAQKQKGEAIHITGEQVKSGLKQKLDIRWDKQGYHPKIGMGVHTKEEAMLAKEYKMDYVFVSHIFPTDCKKGVKEKGLGFLSEVKKTLAIPIYALGGIHIENAALCIQTGADGVCLMSDFMKTKQPKILVEKIRNSYQK